MQFRLRTLLIVLAVCVAIGFWLLSRSALLINTSTRLIGWSAMAVLVSVFVFCVLRIEASNTNAH